MKRVKLIAAAAAAALSLGVAGAANAALVFVGSWQVDSGPSWDGSPPNGPLAYTGQEAAATIFGGSAGDYSISTNGSSVGSINFMAWYSVIGYGGNQSNGGSLLAQDFSLKYLGQFYGPTDNYTFDTPEAATSAYVKDNA